MPRVSHRRQTYREWEQWYEAKKVAEEYAAARASSGALCECEIDDDPCGETHCPFCLLPLPGVEQEEVAYAPPVLRAPAEAVIKTPQPAYSKDECVTTIKKHLNAVESAEGLEAKVAAARILFEDLLTRLKFIKDYPRFQAAVLNKISELSADPKAKDLRPTLDVLWDELS